MRAPSGHSLVHSEEELKMLVTASQEAGVIEEDEEQMLHRVFGFADLTAGQVMVPRTEMVAIAADAPMDGVLQAVARGAHDRYPDVPQEPRQHRRGAAPGGSPARGRHVAAL